MPSKSTTRAAVPTALATTSVVAASGFGVLAVKTARRKTSYVDGRARAKVPKRKKKETKAIAVSLGRFGKAWMQTPVGLLLGAYLIRRGATRGGAILAATSVLSYVLSESFDHILPHRSPPPGRRSPTTPSFPSGHTLRTTAVVSTAAYIASREGLIDWRIAIVPGLALGPLAALDRVYLDRHWVSDTVAGWLCGISLAAGSAAAYELVVRGD